MSRFPRRPVRLLALAACLASIAAAADAATLRSAGRGDPQTIDRFADENLTISVNALIYDTLVVRDQDLE